MSQQELHAFHEHLASLMQEHSFQPEYARQIHELCWSMQDEVKEEAMEAMIMIFKLEEQAKQSIRERNTEREAQNKERVANGEPELPLEKWYPVYALDIEEEVSSVALLLSPMLVTCPVPN